MDATSSFSVIFVTDVGLLEPDIRATRSVKLLSNHRNWVYGTVASIDYASIPVIAVIGAIRLVDGLPKFGVPMLGEDFRLIQATIEIIFGIAS